MSSVITIGFTGRTRACLRTEFTPPIADDERREVLVHVALLTARTFAALSAENQLTFAGTLREWIEDQFIACPTRLVPGDPMACLPRFASTFVAPVREYALASKGCNQNGRGIEFFLPMALVSFLRHIAVSYPDPEDLLKPALAMCGAVVIQPLTMETHFQAAAASLPKIAPVVERTVEEEAVPEEPVRSAYVPREPVAKAAPPAASARPRRHRRRNLILSACLAGLLIMVGVQYFSVHQPEIKSPPGRESIPPRPPVTSLPERRAPVPAPPQPVEVPRPSAPVVAPPAEITEQRVEPPAGAMPSAPPSETAARKPELPPVQPPPAPIVEQPVTKAVDQTEEAAPASPNIRLYQQEVYDLSEDAVAQVEVMVNAIEGQILTQFSLREVLAYGERAVQADLQRLKRLSVPAVYQGQHHEILGVVGELVRLARELKNAKMQPPAAELQDRLAAIRARLDEALSAVGAL